VEHDLFRKPVPTPDQVGGRPFRDHALPGRETIVRGTAARILCVIALGLGLAGCDKCGHFFGFAAPYGLDVCKPGAPKQ
jgi:hypothetical protein